MREPLSDLFLNDKILYFAMRPCSALSIFMGSLFIFYNALCIKIHFDAFLSIPAIFLPTTMLQ